MEETKTPTLTPEQQESLKNKKAVADLLRTTIQILTQRVQYYHEEFEYVHKLVAFHNAALAPILKEIELLEPPKEKTEAKAPYVMDLGVVKPEAASTGVQ